MCAATLSVRHIIAWSLIVHGKVGKLLDRISYDRRVADFINFGIGSLGTGMPNVADVWVTSGLGLLIFMHSNNRLYLHLNRQNPIVFSVQQPTLCRLFGVLLLGTDYRPSIVFHEATDRGDPSSRVFFVSVGN